MRHSLTVVLCLLSLTLFSQRKNARVTLSFESASLDVIFDSLTAQTDYFFSYNSDLLPQGSLFTIEAQDLPIDQFLSKLLVGTNLKYSFFKDQIIINYEAPDTPVVRRRKLFSITGKVVDETGQPLTGVNVFLDGTTFGASTDIDGNYLLDKVAPGAYDLVFSFIGYEKAVYQLSEYNGGARMQFHQMVVQIEELPEVAVVTNRISNTGDRWPIYYRAFREELFGTAPNANHCRINNPEVLNFSYDQQADKLMAYASAPIEITNEAMAYNITYYLESFEQSNTDLRYRGRMQFQNAFEKGGQFTKRQVKKERKRSYLGSYNHFKKALLTRSLRKEGFRIYESSRLRKVKFSKLKELTEADILTFKGTSWELQFSNYLMVVYTKERESINFLMDGDYASVIYAEEMEQGTLAAPQPGKQLSFLKLLNGPVDLDLNGQVLDKFAITSFGYWSWERLANLVPINFDPKADNF